MFKEKLPIFMLLAALLPGTGITGPISNYQDNMELLKEEILVLQDQLEEISASSTNRMSISGYTDIEYHKSSKSGEEPGFRLHHMSLFFEKRFSDEWKFFSEIEYEDAPYIEFDGDPAVCKSNCSGKIFLEAVNFSYLWDQTLNFRAGRFFTPAGLWSVDHYPPFVATQQRPQHIRKVFPQVVDGVMGYGSVPLGNIFFNYDIYLGNGEGNPGKKDLNSKKAVGSKIAFIFPSFKYLELGASTYKDKLNSNADNADKTAQGAHLKFSISNLTLQSEYAKAKIEPETGNSYEEEGYYVQLHANLGKWTIGLRNDVFDTYDSATGLNNEITFNSAFTNYRVNESIVVKLEHHVVDNEDPVEEDYNESIASVVIYLGN